MTETEVRIQDVPQLQKSIAHLTGISDDGWVLKWEDSPRMIFEIVCQKATTTEVEALEKVLNEGYEKAITHFK